MFYDCPDKLCYARVVLISQEQFEEAVSGVAAVLRRAWVDAPEDRVRAWAREAVYAAEAVLLPPGSVSEERDPPRERGMSGQDVGVDPRLERHQAEQAPGPDLAVLRVVAETTCQAGPTTLFLADGSGNVYRVAAERL